MSKLTILVNLGTPDQPFEKEVRTYLREFLSDKYVIRLPRIFWLTLLNLVILRTRPKKALSSTGKYGLNGGHHYYFIRMLKPGISEI